MDLGRLLGGQSFTVPSQVAHNGISIPLSALADTGANGYLFLNTHRATEIAEFLRIPIQQLDQPSRTKGFDGQPGPPITHVVVLHLWIGGRRFLNQPFLILDLGQHDMIVGRKWFMDQDVWLDVKNHRLIWPNQRPLTARIQAKQNTIIPKQILKRPIPTPEHQNHMEYWDKLWRRDCYQQPGTTEQDHHASNGKRMQALAPENPNQGYLTETATLQTDAQEEVRQPASHNKKLVDIAIIGAVPFHRHLSKEGTEACITSLLEID